MKFSVLTTTMMATLAAATPIAPSNNVNDVEIPSAMPESPSVDETSTRSQWVSSYKPRQGHPETLDETSTRSQWVSSYKPRQGHPEMLDETSTRSQWVSSYKPRHSWLPSGPDYLDLDNIDLSIHHTGWMAMTSSESNWGILNVVKRYLSFGGK